MSEPVLINISKPHVSVADIPEIIEVFVVVKEGDDGWESEETLDIFQSEESVTAYLNTLANWQLANIRVDTWVVNP